MLSNVSRKGSYGGTVLEASRALKGEAFLVCIHLRSDRRSYLVFRMLYFWVQDTYVREKKEAGN